MYSLFNVHLSQLLGKEISFSSPMFNMRKLEFKDSSMNIVLIACVQPIIEKRTISCEEYDLPLVANLMRVSMPMMSIYKS